MQEFKIKSLINSITFVALLATVISCNNKKTSSSPYGIGPISHVELTTISDSLMQVGQQLFKDKCTECHTMEYKNSGPDISDILANKKPEWIMNFLLNKEEMLQKDSLAIYTRNKYKVDCGASITEEHNALELLEYFRIYQIWLHEFNGLYE